MPSHAPRRLALALLTAAAMVLHCGGAAAQAGAKVPRVAFLGMDSGMQAAFVAAFLEGMRSHGYRDGHNVAIEYRWAEGRFERLPELAAELVAMRPDVIVTAAPPAVRAVQKATSTIPTIVLVHDPVGQGFAEALQRPGRNITGVAFQDSELSAKRMEVLRQFVPKLERVAVIWNREGGGMGAVKALEATALGMGVQVRAFEITQPVAELPAAVAAAKAWGAQGVLQLASPVITRNRSGLIEAAARERIPMLCEMRSYVVDGCLATYGASLSSMFRTLADFVHRVLQGARVDAMPIEQPREFEFVVNQKTADRLGLALSQTLRLQVTEVIP